jgi:tetratricopeptide (TPR) repeat protein
MARPLKVAVLVSVLLAGCSATPLTKTPTQRLNRVLTMQQDADTAYRSNDMEHAVALYLQLTRMIPQEADYWYMLGNSYVRTQQPDRAVEAYQQALVRNPDHTRAWHNLGIVRMRQAMAAFASSANTAKAEDPMHGISTQLANELSRIGSGGAGASGKLQEQVSMTSAQPGVASRPRGTTEAAMSAAAAGLAATPAGSSAAKPAANDPSPVRRRPGTFADGAGQP